eukprot:1415941-Prymnesium_polylepis.2
MGGVRSHEARGGRGASTRPGARRASFALCLWGGSFALWRAARRQDGIARNRCAKVGDSLHIPRCSIAKDTHAVRVMRRPNCGPTATRQGARTRRFTPIRRVYGRLLPAWLIPPRDTGPHSCDTGGVGRGRSPPRPTRMRPRTLLCQTTKHPVGALERDWRVLVPASHLRTRVDGMEMEPRNGIKRRPMEAERELRLVEGRPDALLHEGARLAHHPLNKARVLWRERGRVAHKSSRYHEVVHVGGWVDIAKREELVVAVV